jgi:hypothetical protein
MNNTAAFLALQLDLNPGEATDHQINHVYVVRLFGQ